LSEFLVSLFVLYSVFLYRLHPSQRSRWT